MIDSLGDRMKRYESVSQSKLMRRTPVIIRLDMKSGTKYCHGLAKPFDEKFRHAMARTTLGLCEYIQGAVFGYTQSDEITILLQDWATLTTDSWFDSNVQKMVSVSASFCTGYFNSVFENGIRVAVFDARVFNLPFEEVANCLVWRQKDATRNSINSLAQSQFSHKELQGKNTSQVQDMLMLQKGINWNDTPTKFKRGVCVVSDENGFHIDEEPPIFSANRDYVERYLYHERNAC